MFTVRLAPGVCLGFDTAVLWMLAGNPTRFFYEGLGGVEVVLISNRTQALGLELFRNLGIEPAQRKLVVVKSTNHFMAAFGPIAEKVIYVDSDAPLARDYRKIAYRRVQRPIWPLDEETKPGLIF